MREPIRFAMNDCDQSQIEVNSYAYNRMPFKEEGADYLEVVAARKRKKARDQGGV